MQVSQWALNIVQAFKDQDSLEVVRMLDPKIVIKNKDKVNHANSLADFSQARHFLQTKSICPDVMGQETFYNWCISFLTHSHLLSQKSSWENQGLDNEIFSAFTKCFTSFIEICKWDALDGPWISSIVDHLCALLIQYAKAADIEAMMYPYLIKQQSPDATPSDSQKVESAISSMVNLFKVVINSTKETDNRKVASYFVVLHNIRASFMVNQFFLCDRFFKTLERPDGIDLDSLPKGW